MSKIQPLRDDLMVQQQIETKWQRMVGVIMLNQTGRKPVKTVLPEFLSNWPDAETYLNSTPEEVIVVLFVILALPLAWMFAPRKHGVIVYNCSIAEISPDYPVEVKEQCRKLNIQRN